MSINFNDKGAGVSPVIGVILMVAVTVALVALVTVVVFDLGGDVSENPDATVQLQENDGQVQARILRNENVNQVLLEDPDGTRTTVGNSAGDSAKISSGTGIYSVIAVMPDGNEQVLTNKEFSVESVVSGIVSYNPPAEDVIVELVDGDSNVLDSDKTDSSGSYTLSGSASTLQIRVDGQTVSPSNPNIDLLSSGVVGSTSEIPSLLMDGDGTSGNPYNVETASDLQSMKYDLDANYKLVNNIDASNTLNWNNGDGFEPVGPTFSSSFDGTFNGSSYEIDGLYIDRGSTENIGLFGYVNTNGEITELGITNADIKGDTSVGGLVGSSKGTISNSYSTGSITGNSYVGGLVGLNAGSVTNTYSGMSVDGGSRLGGLVGFQQGSITDSYSTGSVTGDSRKVGGLVGDLYSGSVSNSYATGSISGSSEVGGLIGDSGGSVSGSYWDTESTGASSSAAGTGLTTSEMQGSSSSTNMGSFDFSGTWSTVSEDYPVLSELGQQEQLDSR